MTGLNKFAFSKLEADGELVTSFTSRFTVRRPPLKYIRFRAGGIYFAGKSFLNSSKSTAVSVAPSISVRFPRFL